MATTAAKSSADSKQSTASGEAPSNVDQVLEQDPTSFGAMITTDASTGLVPVEDIMPVGRVYEDDPDFDTNEVAMPRLRIAQGLTPEVSEGTAKPGDMLVLGYEPEKKVLFIPVMFARTRRRGDPTDQMAMPLCQSPNGRVGIGDPGVECKLCRFARWQPPLTEGGKGVPPECVMSYSYVGYSVTHESIVEFTIRAKSKGSTDAAKKLNMFVQNIGLGKFAIEVSAAPTKNAKGAIFHIPTITKVTLPPEELEAARNACTIAE